jgi:hypothetical protein
MIGPWQAWAWDITKLLGPAKWTYYYLYRSDRYAKGGEAASVTIPGVAMAASSSRKSTARSDRHGEEACEERGEHAEDPGA